MAVRRSALITGATRGIGRAVAGELARRGYALTIAGRDGSLLDAARDELLEEGAPEVVVATGDVGDADHVASVVAGHGETFGSMNALVLAAGTGYSAPLDQYPVKWFDRQFQVNTRSSFIAVRESLPLLLQGAQADPEHGARVIVLASITGVVAEAGLAAYGASKAANLSLCRSICAEYAERGVSATAIAPGYVDTDMSKWVRDEIPQGEMITVEDIAILVAALVQMSARAVVPEMVVSRAGTNGMMA